MKTSFYNLSTLVGIVLTVFACVVLTHTSKDTGWVRNANANGRLTVAQPKQEDRTGWFIPSAFTRDGSILAVIEDTGAITLREMPSGRTVWSRYDTLNDNSRALTFSADGKTLASSGDNGTALWNVSTGQARMVSGFDGVSSGIQLSGDGRRLAGVDFNNAVVIGNLETGKFKTISTEKGAIPDLLGFTPDNKFFVSVLKGVQSKIRVWDVVAARAHFDRVSETKITDVSLSPDGKTLASAEQNGVVKLIDLQSGVVKRAFDTREFITKIRFSADGKFLAIGSGGNDPQVQLWNAVTGQLLFANPSESGAVVTDLHYSPDGKLLASLGDNYRISLWSLPSGTLQQILTGPADVISSSAFTAKQPSFAAISQDGQLFLWDFNTGNVQETFQFALAKPSFPSMQPQVGAFFVGSAQQATLADTIRVNNHPVNAANANAAVKPSANPSKNTGRSPFSKTDKRNAHRWKGARALAFSQDGLELGSAGDDGALRIYKKSGKVRWTVKGHHGNAISGLAFRVKGKSKEWVSIGADTEIKTWSDATGNNTHTFYGPEHPPRAVAVSPDGRFIATAGEDTRIMIFDAVANKLNAIFSGHSDFVNGLAFSADGKFLASAGAEGRILVWNFSDGKRLNTLLGHSGEVNAVSFSPDGTLLASASADGSVILWDVASGREFKKLNGHQASVRSVAFSPNGKKLISAGEDTRLLVWDAQTGQIKKQIGGQAAVVNTLVFDPAGKLHTAGENSEIAEIDTDTGVTLNKIVLPAATANDIVGKADSESKDGLIAIDHYKNGAIVEKVNSQNSVNAHVRVASSLINKLFDWVIPAAEAALPDPNQGPGGNILVITSGTSNIGKYYAEILRAEGLNEFLVADIATVDANVISGYDVVILAQMNLSAEQVTLLQTWVNGGGNLIAMRPDKQLAGLLGITDVNSTLSNGYVLVNTSTSPGNGIVGQTLQFHGSADRYALNGATSVAMLYSDANTATTNPAVTLRNVGVAGGQAAAFTYDLATSVVYTHQGNPAWASMERDGFAPIRSDDKFFGNAAGDQQADWIDFNKLAIPQADEQQRLLANLILEMNKDKKPLPRFWYFPSNKKAVVVMTGDDHNNNGTTGRFNQFNANSPAACSSTSAVDPARDSLVKNWQCLRGTSYMFPSTPMTAANANIFNAQGFELGLHVNTNCADFSPAQLETFYTEQIAQWTGTGSPFNGLPAPITQRHHCIAWSDWATGAKVQYNHGIRFDTSYYFWPPNWVQNRPGLFSGSGMPMRFVDLDGTMIDVYQATSQMTDESGQSYPSTLTALLDNAVGPNGFYGAFTINAHTDIATIPESDAVIATVQDPGHPERNVPVISSRQMLDWLDYRNSSSFSGLSWNDETKTLTFTVVQPTDATKVPDNPLRVLLPKNSVAGVLSTLKSNGNDVSFNFENMKGVDYATFTGLSGTYTATYVADTVPPTISSRTPSLNATNVNLTDVITIGFSEPLDAATVNAATLELRDPQNALVPSVVSYNSQIATITPNAALLPSTTYSISVKGGTTEPTIKDLSGNALSSNEVWFFTTGADPCATATCSAWTSNALPGTPVVNDPGSVNLGVKFRSDNDGLITGIRFYQATTGVTYTGSLWTSSGQLLSSGTVTATTPGWQQLNLATPVSISANQIYVASYFAPNGNYAVNGPSFAAAGVDAPPIHLLQDGVSGGNGVYAYSASSTFPTESFNASNYWVDVVFTTSTAADNTPPTVVQNAPAANAANVGVTASVTATFSESIDASTINATTFELRNQSNELVAANVTYNAGTRTATLIPSASLANSATYTAKVVGGVNGVKDNSVNHNPLATDFTWTFTTNSQSTSGCSGVVESIWPSNPTPATLSDSDTSSVELGVKFQPVTDGFICGIRFFKSAANTGTHVGKLWSSTGNLLADAVFQNETASGWQQVYFSNPVPIIAGNQYIASYVAPVGRYSANNNYFTTGVTSGFLYALSSVEGGGNGVYQYGSGGFPTNSFQSTNYWVDVMFTSNLGPDTTPPTVTGTSPAADTTGVNPNSAVKATFNEQMSIASINAANFFLTPTVPGIALNYDVFTRSASLTPSVSNPLASNTTYTATVMGGASGVTDNSGNPLANNFTWTFTTGVDPCSAGGNEIVCENGKPGNPASEWDVGGGSANIEGFATDMSVNRGSAVEFKIDSKLADYHLEIFRMGYYNGLGARKVASLASHAGVSQAACFNQTSTGLIDCGNWSVTDTWNVPATSTSGIYFAKAIIDSGANAGQANHVFFIVRDDASTSDILFQTSDTTWQAYNNWGGNSLYTGSPAGRAYKVSYNRPFNTRNVDGGQDWVFNAEYPMVRWLEANGYNVSYFTGVDSDRFGSLIRNHKVFLSVGHDEYWSKSQRANVEAARDAATNPVNLVFLSGNEVFWKTRWENNITNNSGALGANSYRTMVCYKETHNFPNNVDGSSVEWTGTWRDPRGLSLSPQKTDGGNPENSLTGTLFMVNEGATTSIQVPEAEGKMRLWRNTSVANLATGATATLPFGTLGYEWDVDVDNGFRPAGLIQLSSTTVPNAPVLTDNGSTFASATAVHTLEMYKAASGSRVFGAGTVQWSWGLDGNHDRPGTPVSADMRQATVNLLADLGVQPGSLQSGLVATAASSDTTPPSSVITAPLNNAVVTPNTTITVTGTATDAAARVAAVEVSVNGGAWRPASGRENWSFSLTAPSTNSTLTIRSRAVDDSLNSEIPSAGITLNVGSGVDNTPPSIPTNVVTTVIGGNQINLDWDDSTDNVAVTGYQVERCQGALCTAFTSVGTPISSAFNNSGLTDGVTYRYRVRATDANNNLSGYSTIVTVATPDITPPNTPTSLTANVTGSSQINLSWTAPTDNVAVASYQLERCQGVGCSNFVTIANPTVTNQSDTGLTANTTYRYRVLAKDAAGNASAYSAVASVTTQALPIVSTGYLSPSSSSPVTAGSGDNNGFQTSPSNAYSNNAIFASDIDSGTSNSSSCTSTGKDRHIFGNFGFNLPIGASIKGIQIRLDARVDSQGSFFFPNAPMMCVELSWNAGASWVTAKTTPTLATTETTYVLGTTTDVWGRTWGVNDFTNANFRIRITNVASGISGANSRDFYLDWAAVQVTYQ